MKTKRELKIIALEIASKTLDSIDCCMWDNEEEFTFKEQLIIVKFIQDIGFKLFVRCEKLKNAIKI